MHAGLISRGLVLAAAVTALAPARSIAQYTAPGSLAELPGNRKERVEKAADEARWGAGRLRLEPWVSLSDGGYFFEEVPQPDGSTDLEGDLSATAGAGLRAYLRTGSRLIWAAHGKLDYVWWADRDERRTALGQYGLGLFGKAGRVGMEITATRAEGQQIFTAEALRRAPNRTDALRADFDVELGRGLFLRLGGGETRSRVLDPEEQGTEDLAQLDRDEQRLDARVGYRFRGGLAVSLGYETSTADFVADRDRSNDGTAWLADVSYTANRLSLSAAAARREIESQEGSSFGTFTGTTYRVQVGLGAGRRISPVLYAQRELAYTVDLATSYALDERLGASLSVSLGRRTNVQFFGETGELTFLAGDEGAERRADDLTAWGASVGLELGRRTRLRLGYRSTSYDSDRPGADREVREIVAGIGFGGQSEGPWY